MLCVHTGGSKLSLQMSQLLGPEDGFKVVALLADGDPWRQHEWCSALLLVAVFQNNTSARADLHAQGCAGCAEQSREV